MTKNLEDALESLNLIYENNRDIIEGDKLLERYFLSLKACLPVCANDNNDELNIRYGCNEIVDHLTSELKECIIDEQRINDESPACEDRKISLHNQELVQLKRDLDKFIERYA